MLMPPVPEMPASCPVPLEGTMEKNCADWSLPAVDAESRS
jgi:hypothetical protein